MGRRTSGRRDDWRKHQGVALIKKRIKTGRFRWLIRFEDENGQTKYETVPAHEAGEDGRRSRWVQKRAEELRERKKVVAAGAPAKKGLTLRDAAARYFVDVATLRPATLEVYNHAVDLMLSWAEERSIDADDLRGEHLMAFRAWLINRPRRTAAKGAARGERVDAAVTRASASINRDLRAIKTCLEHLRRLGLVPLITRDSIADSLENLPMPRPVPVFLKSSELLAIIEAARQHDAATVEGKTYARVLPYFALTLLTGMRKDEARSLRWSAVDLAAAPSGMITLRPEHTKTKHGRQVDLAVSPILRELLAALKSTAGDAAHVFGDLSLDEIKAGLRRMVSEYTAPHFSWQQLRVTCGTFLANAPGIFGGASAYREARQLGHSVTVAEKHYLGVVHVDPAARTLEDAMQITLALRSALGLTVAVVVEPVKRDALADAERRAL